MINKKIPTGKIIKETRINNDMTQEYVCKYLGIQRSTYQYYEDGKALPDIFTFQLLAKLFKIDMENLIQVC